MAKKPMKGSEPGRKIIGTLEESLSLQLSIVGSIKDALEKVGRTLSQNEKTQRAWAHSAQIIQISTFKLTGVLNKFVTEAIQLQRDALIINKSFVESSLDVAKKIEGVPGGMQAAMQTALAFEREGLDFVGRSTVELGTRMQVLGQSIVGLIRLDKQLLIQGQFSRGQIENLNATLHSLTTTYQVSTENLIAGLVALEKSLPLLGLAGVGAQVSEAVGELTAQFPAMTKELAMFVNALAGPQADIGMLQVIGGLEGAEALTSGQVKSAEQLRRIIETIANASEGMLGDFKDLPLAAKQQMMQVIGPGGQLAIQLRNAMGETGPRGAGGGVDKILEDAVIAFKTAVAPLAQSLGKIVTGFAPLFSVLGKIFGWLEKFKIVSGALLTFFGARYVWPLLLSIRNLTAAMVIQTRKLAAFQTLMTTQQARGQFPLARANLLKSLGIGLLFTGIAMGLTKLFTVMQENKAKNIEALNKLAEAELVRAQTDAASRRELFGQSRFELLSKQIINDSITRVATREAVLMDALNSLGGRIVTAIDGTTTAIFDTGEPPVVLTRGGV